ncbi:hypothetical protein [[Acidovorax] ebreus]|uniref:hypothetical protein n=1 Tax=Diaphorobacter sp. LI3 TaxID=2952886 RepID=UPI0020459AAE|nr:hypothetical protein MRB47_17300 [Diaphorobacter sp. LI3]
MFNKTICQTVYRYQAKCFSEACRSLMLPFSEGEAAAIANAFHLCHKALEEHRLKKSKVERESVQAWLDVVEKTMDTAGLEDPNGVGLWRIKAQSLTEQEKSDFSGAVYELAGWFDMQFWSSAG